MVFSEFESDANAILISFNVQDQALLDILSGRAEPSARLPMQMPASMSAVEKQAEDVPQDMPCHQDSEGHRYDFGFGMNWKGAISDARTQQYVGPIANKKSQ
jgi:beta-glucosidase